MTQTFELDAGGFNIRYELQRDGFSVKRTVLSCSDGTDGGQPVNESISPWKWGPNGWTGQGSRSGTGYEVAKAFGLK